MKRQDGKMKGVRREIERSFLSLGLTISFGLMREKALDLRTSNA